MDNENKPSGEPILLDNDGELSSAVAVKEGGSIPLDHIGIFHPSDSRRPEVEAALQRIQRAADDPS